MGQAQVRAVPPGEQGLDAVPVPAQTPVQATPAGGPTPRSSLLLPHRTESAGRPGGPLSGPSCSGRCRSGERVGLLPGRCGGRCGGSGGAVWARRLGPPGAGVPVWQCAHADLCRGTRPPPRPLPDCVSDLWSVFTGVSVASQLAQPRLPTPGSQEKSRVSPPPPYYPSKANKPQAPGALVPSGCLSLCLSFPFLPEGAAAWCPE